MLEHVAANVRKESRQEGSASTTGLVSGSTPTAHDHRKAGRSGRHVFAASAQVEAPSAVARADFAKSVLSCG